jgi:hypothetical protein
MLKSGLFYAILKNWQKRLGRTGAQHLLNLAARLDFLVQAECPLEEGLLWAAFLTPYLEREELPETLAGLREVMPGKVREALGAIEFPRQRQEEVSQVLALARAASPYLLQGQPVPARLTRLAFYGDAWRLHQFLMAPEAQLPELLHQEEGPVAAAPVRRRRHRRRRPRGAGPATPKS